MEKETGASLVRKIFDTPFRPGDLVRWESQSQGSWKEKRGEVVAVIPAGLSAFRFLPSGKPNKEWRAMFTTDVAKIDRVLVRVQRVRKRDGQVLGWDYYCPRLSQVLIVEARGWG
ncbi:hypothetical protein [Alicyclobacillus macrosporangiidus]|uniref:Uncharacterized protein n=1 Tax=Alicyclobacillus macrosporangiidus TaxID=392015 RepID=A0A1I7LEQ0_9BACL|nr:hypothetical protein [Alicyclobacillus macrosporangiidus]SFV08056.1 hypothetical protein SAMN05421543_14110 [Alicyclobacillus macrosporangiidus]